MSPCPIVAIMIHVADVPAALAWYAEAFPTAVLHTTAENDFTHLIIGGVRLELVPADAKVGSGAYGSVVYWRTDNLSATLSRLEKIGARLYRGPMAIEDQQWICQLRDPWGNCIGLCGSHA